MRNVKLGLFTMLAMITAGIGFSTAFDIQVWPQDYYWTLTLNKINIMKNNSITWIVLDGTWYSIKIWQGSPTDTWSIRVRQICDRSWNNCKLISQLSTSDTWIANSEEKDGYVTAWRWQYNKVRKTNDRGEPSRQDDATGSISVTANTTSLNRGWQSTIITVNGTSAKVTMPSNPHYVWSIIAASTNNWNTNTSTTNTTTYLNYVENSSVKSYLQLKWSGNTTVSASNGVITITSTWGDEDSLWQTGSNNILKPKLNSYELWIWNTGIVLKGSWYQYCNDYGSFVYGPVIGYESSLVLKQYSSTYECVTSFIAINMNWLWIGWIPTQNDNLLINGSAKINWNYLRNNKVWLQKIPTSAETLQVYGWIQITENNTPYNNKTCDESLEGSIEYYSGNFYGCNGSKRKAFSFWAAL